MRLRSSSAQWKKLRDKQYREEFVAAHARRAVPFQIRALMRKRNVSQQELAAKSGLTQGVISRAANPAYGKLTLNTIIRVAAGLDVAFVGAFVPFSKLLDHFDGLSEQELADVATFEEEDTDIVSEESSEPTPARVVQFKGNYADHERRHKARMQQESERRLCVAAVVRDPEAAAILRGEISKVHQQTFPFMSGDQFQAPVNVPPPFRGTPTQSDIPHEMEKPAADALAGQAA
jgi:transcriptional regulator with XRE-family HTH domain